MTLDDSPYLEKEEKQRRINRPAASCVACRKRKTRCNRLDPCEGCISRNEPCVWKDAKPIAANRQANSQQECEAQIARLEAIEAKIRSAADRAEIAQSLTIQLLSAKGGQAQIEDASQATKNAGCASGDGEIDIRGYDICAGFAQCAITHTQSSDPRLGKAGCHAVLDEARVLMKTLPQALALDTNMPSFNPFGAPARTLDQLLYNLPPESLATPASNFYHRYMDSFFHPMHVPTFTRRSAEMRDKIQAGAIGEVDLFFLSTYLAVSALGLETMSPEQATKRGFTIDKYAVSREWLSMSLAALSLGNFFEYPEFEGLRALFLISAYYICQTDGNTTRSGLKTLSLTVQLALDIGMDLDPSEHNIDGNKPLSEIEMEERRRFIHTALAYQTLFSGTLGRASGAVHCQLPIACNLPKDCDDDHIGKPESEITETGRETSMTSVLCRIALSAISSEINQHLFSNKAVEYSTIMRLDAALRRFHDTLPLWYQLNFDGTSVSFPGATTLVQRIRASMVHLAYWTEVLRLHRAFLLRWTVDGKGEYSRDASIVAARTLLGIHRMDEMRQIWSGMNYQSFSAAVALSVNAYYNPASPDIQLHLHEVGQTRDLLRPIVGRSIMAAKAVSILDFLLRKIGKKQLGRKIDEMVRPIKRVRNIDGEGIRSGDAGRHGLNGEEAEDEEDRLVHKTTQTCSNTDLRTSTYQAPLPFLEPGDRFLRPHARTPSHASSSQQSLPSFFEQHADVSPNPSVFSGFDSSPQTLCDYAFDFSLPQDGGQAAETAPVWPGYTEQTEGSSSLNRSVSNGNLPNGGNIPVLPTYEPATQKREVQPQGFFWQGGPALQHSYSYPLGSASAMHPQYYANPSAPPFDYAGHGHLKSSYSAGTLPTLSHTHRQGKQTPMTNSSGGQSETWNDGWQPDGTSAAFAPTGLFSKATERSRSNTGSRDGTGLVVGDALYAVVQDHAGVKW